MIQTFLLLMILSLTTCLLNAWEEDPRHDEYNKKTDYLLKLGNKQVEQEEEETIALLTYSCREKNKSIVEKTTDDKK